METNENENTSVQNLWDTTKAVLRGKYRVIHASLKIIEKSNMQSMGRLGGSVVKRLPQVMIPVFWN